MSRNDGVIADTLFVGITRPPMRFGVTYAALIVNSVVTIEVFVLTKNLLWLLAFLPLHGLCYLLCLYEPRFFDLLLLWARTRGPGLLSNAAFWKANSYSPLALDVARKNNRNTTIPTCRY
jgi:type IV secretion system protein VirB3